MRPKQIQLELQQITRKIIAKFRPEKIILFGSNAWGNPSAESDLDLLIVKKSRQNILDLMRQVDRILSKRTVALDILVYTPQRLQMRLDLGDPFIKKVMDFGRVLYDKSEEENSFNRRVA